MISRRHLAEVIAERTLHVRDTKKLAREVAAYLLDTGQTAQLESLLRDVMEYRAEHGVVEAQAISAHELTPTVIRELQQILKAEHPQAKSVHVIPKLDPAVVGGVRLQMANEQLDLTVRGKLDTFKRLTTAIKE